MSELHAADYDFRYRVNEVINAVNVYGNDFKVDGQSQKGKMHLGFKATREFHSPSAVIYDASVASVASEHVVVPDNTKSSSNRSKLEK